MKTVKNLLLFKKEAYLYDSGLFIIKAFVAVIAAYAIVLRLPLVHKDIISMLFGLMMTLEPVTVTGIRSGMKQLTATILGALVSAIIISILGINVWTVALSVSATLYLCLKINWREVSPVAIFTSIYMTNYVQYTASGEPSVSLTFLLRILALGTGVLIAVIFNFIFSLFFYQRMERKRIIHILTTLKEHLEQIRLGIEAKSIINIEQVKDTIPDTFKSIDWLAALIKDKDKDNNIKKKLGLSKKNDPNLYQDVMAPLRNITHLLYDTTFIIIGNLESLKYKELPEAITVLDELIRECDYMACHYGNDNKQYEGQIKLEQMLDKGDNRIMDNLNGVKKMFDIINHKLFQVI